VGGQLVLWLWLSLVGVDRHPESHVFSGHSMLGQPKVSQLEPFENGVNETAQVTPRTSKASHPL
jgi:hypothetical protein